MAISREEFRVWLPQWKREIAEARKNNMKPQKLAAMNYKVNFTNRSTGVSWSTVSSFRTRDDAHSWAKSQTIDGLSYCVIRAGR